MASEPAPAPAIALCPPKRAASCPIRELLGVQPAPAAEAAVEAQPQLHSGVSTTLDSAETRRVPVGAPGSVPHSQAPPTERQLWSAVGDASRLDGVEAKTRCEEVGGEQPVWPESSIRQHIVQIAHSELEVAHRRLVDRRHPLSVSRPAAFPVPPGGPRQHPVGQTVSL